MGVLAFFNCCGIQGHRLASSQKEQSVLIRKETESRHNPCIRMTLHSCHEDWRIGFCAYTLITSMRSTLGFISEAS